MQRARYVEASLRPKDCIADATQTPLEGTLRDAEPDFPKLKRRRNQTAEEDDMGIPPTQRMSQVSL